MAVKDILPVLFQGKMGAGLAESFMDTGTQTAVDAASKSAMADNAATQEAAHAAAVKNASDMILQQQNAATGMSVIDPNWANNSQIQNAIGQIDAPVYPEKVPFSPATQAAIDKIPTSRGSAFNASISKRSLRPLSMRRGIRLKIIRM